MGDGSHASALRSLDEDLFVEEESEDEYDEDEPRAEERPKAYPKVEPDRSAKHRKLQDTSRPSVNLAESLVEEIDSQSWRDYMKAARKARDERLLHEKYAKYGPFKDIILHPTTQQVLARVDEITDVEWVKPIMPPTYIVIIAFMAHRGGMPGMQYCFMICLLFGVHPHLIILAVVVMKLLFAKNKKLTPKSCSSIPRWPNHYRDVIKAKSKSILDAQTPAPSRALPHPASPDLSKKLSAAKHQLHMTRAEYKRALIPSDLDYVVIGSDIGTIFTAALLARCGKKVLVLEPEGSLKAGCVVDDFLPGVDFVVSDATISGGLEGQSFANMLSSVTLPRVDSNPKLRSRKVKMARANLNSNKLQREKRRTENLKGTEEREDAASNPLKCSASAAQESNNDRSNELETPEPAQTPGFHTYTDFDDEEIRAPRMLPWELDWARIGDGGSSKRCRSANAVHTVVSMDAGRPVLFGSSLSGWLETMRLHGASKPVAFALLRKLFEVKAQAKWSSTKLPEGNDVDVKDAIITRLYGLVGLSGGLKVTQSVEGGNRVRIADPGAFTYNMLLGWSMEKALSGPILVGDFLGKLREEYPSLYQLVAMQAMSLGGGAENLSPAHLAFPHLATTIIGSLEGRYFPKGGPTAILNAMLPSIEAAGGRVLYNVKIDGIVVKADSSSENPSSTPLRYHRAAGVRIKNENTVIEPKYGIVSGLGLHKTWTDLVMKTTGSVNISTSPPGSPNLKGPSALSDKRKPLALERLSGTIPRARPVLHLLVELLGSADDLQLMSADYVEVPPVLDDAGNLLAPSQGGAGCLSSFSRSSVAGTNDPGNRGGAKWMRISFPSAKDPEWDAFTDENEKGISTCVITIEADDEWVNSTEKKKEKLLPGIEKRCVR